MFSNLLSNDAYKEIKFSSLHKTILHQLTNIYLIPFYLNNSTNKILHTCAPPPVLLPYNTYKRTSQFSNQVLQLLSYQTNGAATRSQFSRVI